MLKSEAELVTLNHHLPVLELITEYLDFFCCCYRPQRSCGRVMFSQASVILFTGGGVADPPPADTTPAQCMLGYTHTPLPLPSACWDAHPPPGQTPPCPVHSGIHPPCPVHAGIHPPSPHPSASHCSGRYASYWNAFLFLFCLLTSELRFFFTSNS